MKYIITTTEIKNKSREIKQLQQNLIDILRNWKYDIEFSKVYDGVVTIELSSVNELGWLSKILEKPIIIEYVAGTIVIEVYNDWRE